MVQLYTHIKSKSLGSENPRLYEINLSTLFILERMEVIFRYDQTYVSI